MSIHSFFKRSSGYPGGLRKTILLAGGLFSGTCLWAQAPAPSSIKDPFVLTLVIIMAFLALVIGLLAYIVLGSAELYYQKQKKAAEEKKSQPAVNVATVLVGLLVGLPSLAQDKAGNAVIQHSGYALSDTAFYMMTGVIFVELMVIAVLLYNLRVLLEIRRKRKGSAAQATGKPVLHWWARINKFKPVEQEADMDMGHEYDGIRELDNRLPPWWLYGFYACIVFAAIYLWRYHVSHSAPGSVEEYQLAVKEAEVKRAAYLEKSANNVDENTVKLLTDANDLAAGQKVFETACFACHGKLGEGGVGPNLTDAYWLHGGSVQAIFKTIKYGVPEKGMKSWKDDYSPLQLAQLSSYIHSLKGTNPPNGKAPQGTPDQEDGATATSGADSTARPSGTTQP